MAKPITGMLAYIVAGREIRCSSVHVKCLLQYYCSNVNVDGSFFKSTLDIYADTKLSESFIHRTNAKWKDIGLLSWVEGDWRKRLANRYTLNLAILRTLATDCEKHRDKAKLSFNQKAAERACKYRAKKAASRSLKA